MHSNSSCDDDSSITSDSSSHSSIHALKDSKSLHLTDFKILETLGRGSFGSVYKVLRKSNKQIYALKQIAIGALSPEEQQDSMQEVQILKQLNSPYIIQYYDSFIDQNLFKYNYGILCCR